MAGPLPEFLRELGFLLLLHKGHGRFELLSPVPGWLTELWELPPHSSEITIAEKSPFLENFLFEAEAFWDSNRKGVCQSETWVEKSPAGREIPLEAIALQWEGKRYLALRSAEPQFQERMQLLQTARNSLLDHERLQREIQKKEILLHCIIHDLSQPLSVMSVAFDCMTGEQISSRGKSLLELGKRAGDQQSMMIRDILHVFSADLKASLNAGKPNQRRARSTGLRRIGSEGFHARLRREGRALELLAMVETSMHNGESTGKQPESNESFPTYWKMRFAIRRLAPPSRLAWRTMADSSAHLWTTKALGSRPICPLAKSLRCSQKERRMEVRQVWDCTFAG